MKTGIFATCMLVPVILIVIALISRARPQSDINHTIGYRSRRSMESQENWDKAQKLMAKYLLVIGCVLTVVSLAVGIIMVTTLEQTKMLIVFGILMVVQVISVLLVIPLVESQLK